MAGESIFHSLHSIRDSGRETRTANSECQRWVNAQPSNIDIRLVSLHVNLQPRPFNFLFLNLNSPAGPKDLMEQAHCIYFFSEYANDVISFRPYLSKPAGFPLLVENLRSIRLGLAGISVDIAVLRRFCQILSRLHGSDWCIPTFIQLNLCVSIAELLV